MSSNTREIFGGKSFSDLLKDIYDNSVHKKKQIEILINELRPLISTTNEAAVIVPLIKDYLEVGVKNDEQLVKMAGVFQKYMAFEDRVNSFNSGTGGNGILTEQEKEELLNTVANELMKNESIENNNLEISKEFDDLLSKTDEVKSKVSGSKEK